LREQSRRQRNIKARLEGAAAAGKPKSTKYKHKATPEQQSLAGRAGRLLGRAGAARQHRELKGEGRRKPRHGENEISSENTPRTIKTPEQIVFEGRRASSKDGRPKDLKFGKVRGNKKGAMAKLKNRGARRAADWRHKGGK
jgi:nucleolar protein 12